MPFLSSLRSFGEALGIWKSKAIPIGCALGRSVYRETKRSTQLANVRRTRDPLAPATIARLQPLFPGLDLKRIRVRNRCRLPSNRFRQSGSIYAMTFGYTIYWRDQLDESDPVDLVKLIHEVVHVDQVRRFGSESSFACEYGKGYIEGGGVLPDYIGAPSAYHRNPLESEAYSFEAQFRNTAGRVVPSRLPPG